MKHGIILFFCILLFISGCAVPYRTMIKDGKKYCTTRGVFKSRWYNYFERSLSCIEGKFYKQALHDLNIAIKQRNQDQRMARTFGMHFIDYFPHREKGLAHFLMGDYEFAEFEFNLSVQQEPSAKAFYYLDEIRKIKLKKSKHLKSMGPKIIIDNNYLSAENGIILTKDYPFILKGTLSDSYYISLLLISNKNYMIDKSSKQICFSKKIELSNGKHQIDIIAENLIGKKSNLKLFIHLDRAGPVISIQNITFDSEIIGSIKDETGIKSLFINDKKVNIKEGKFINFKASKIDLSKQIIIKSKDILGNRSELILIKDEIDELFNDFYTVNDTYNIVSDAKSILKNPYKINSRIILDNLKEHNTAYLRMVNIRGRVESKSNIKSLTINSDPIDISSGFLVSFDYPLLLKNDKNEVIIQANDSSGHIVNKSIFIKKEIPSHFKYNERYKVVTYDFSNMYWFENPGILPFLYSKIIIGGKKEKITGDFLRSIFTDYAKKRNRFCMIDKSMFEPSNASLFGKIRITRVGVELSARLIDNKTSEVIANKGIVKDVYFPRKSSPEIKRMIEKLYEKFHKELPVAYGNISELQNDSFICSLNNNQIRMNWPVIIYNESQVDNNLGSKTKIISQGFISGATKLGYKGFCGNISSIKPGYKIITR